MTRKLLGSGAVAAFVFLTAAAGTHLVAPDLGLVALHGFGGRFVIFIRVELLHATAGAGRRAEKLFDLLRRLRQYRGLSVGQIAVRAGLSRSHVSEVLCAGGRHPARRSPRRSSVPWGAARAKPATRTDGPGRPGMCGTTSAPAARRPWPPRLPLTGPRKPDSGGSRLGNCRRRWRALPAVRPNSTR